MIRLKTEKQIDGIRKSCRMLSAMFSELEPLVKPGVQTIEIDAWVQTWIKKAGAKPAFLGYMPTKDYDPYPAAICISINDEVIHGIPSKRKIKEGDLVGLDCGIELDGFISDRSISVEAGIVSEKVRKLNSITKEALEKGILAMKAGNRLSQISRAIEGVAKEAGFGIVRDYCGHGVGLSLHEDPQVPNYPHGPNPRLQNGMVFALEPMIAIGTGETIVAEDGWTVLTKDSTVCAHWEHTVAIVKDKTEILTMPH